MTAPKKHLHIAFAGAGGGVGIVVKDESHKVVFERHAGGEGPERFHPWQALIQGLQLAVELGADAVTLYSHHGNLANMAKLSAGKSETSPELGGYSAAAWQLLFGAFMGEFCFKVIPEEKNPAVQVAQGEAVG